MSTDSSPTLIPADGWWAVYEWDEEGKPLHRELRRVVAFGHTDRWRDPSSRFVVVPCALVVNDANPAELIEADDYANLVTVVHQADATYIRP